MSLQQHLNVFLLGDISTGSSLVIRDGMPDHTRFIHPSDSGNIAAVRLENSLHALSCLIGQVHYFGRLAPEIQNIPDQFESELDFINDLICMNRMLSGITLKG